MNTETGFMLLNVIKIGYRGDSGVPGFQGVAGRPGIKINLLK